MSIETLAGGAAVMGIAVIMMCHEALRSMRMKRALIGSSRISK